VSFTSLSLDHLAFPIFDVEKSLAFYGQVLGLPLVDAMSGDDWDGRRWLMMMLGLADQRQVVLVAFEGAQPPAMTLPKDARHLAFSVETDEALADWKHKLDQLGIAFTTEDHGPQRSIYLDDPNGIVIEITTPASRVTSLRPEIPPSRAVVERFLAGRDPLPR
jgi:glyoxylase I family protein